MISSTRKSPVEKKRRGRPRVDAADIMVAVPPPLLAELEEFRTNVCSDEPGRPEAIRRLMMLALTRLKKGGLIR